MDVNFLKICIVVVMEYSLFSKEKSMTMVYMSSAFTPLRCFYTVHLIT